MTGTPIAIEFNDGGSVLYLRGSHEKTGISTVLGKAIEHMLAENEKRKQEIDAINKWMVPKVTKKAKK